MGTNHHPPHTHGKEWVGGLTLLPPEATGEPEPYDVLMWLIPGERIVGVTAADPGRLFDQAAKHLQATMRNPKGGPSVGAPSRVRVASTELANALRKAFPKLEIVCAPTPELDEMVIRMSEALMTEPEDSIEVASPEAIRAVVEELVRRGNDPTLSMADRIALEEPLLDAFVVSKEGKPFATSGMTSLLMDYCHDRLGATLVAATPDQLRELLFTLLPRHTRFDADSAPIIVGETRAFFTYLKAHHGLAQADASLEVLGEGAEAELAAALSDRRNFGDDKVSAMNAALDSTGRRHADALRREVKWDAEVGQACRTTKSRSFGGDGKAASP